MNRLASALRATLLGAFVACSPSAATPPPATAEPAPERLHSFQLQDAPALDVLRAMSSAAGAPLVVSPEAQQLAPCTRLSLFTPEPVPMTDLEALMTRAMADSPLVLRIDETGWVVAKKHGAQPSCERRGPPEDRRSRRHDLPLLDTIPAEEITAQIVGSIRQVGDHSYEVPAQAFGRMLEHPLLMRSARIVPAMQGDEVVGMRVFGIREGKLLHVLGLRNGDQLETINGYPLTSPDKALEAYANVRSARTIDVAIVRRGKPITLTYTIVQ